MVWSTDAGLPSGPGQKLTKGRVYAHLNYGGDLSAAASALRNGTAVNLPPGLVSRHCHAAGDPDHSGAGPRRHHGGADFWDATAALTHIRDFAYSRMTSPWAVLGVVLLRVLATVPPNVVLPPLIGDNGSLNLFVAVVGSSGVGKGSAESAATKAVHLPDIYTAPVGSGEGIAHQYAHRETGKVVRDRDSVLFTVSEVDTLTALGQRTGSTLLPPTPVRVLGRAAGLWLRRCDEAAAD